MAGLQRRFRRLFHAHSGRTVLVPLDHGLTEGLLPGLEHTSAFVDHAARHAVQGVVLHQGAAEVWGAPRLALDQRLVVHLSGGTRYAESSYRKTGVCSVDQALRSGADAVSVHVNIGNRFEGEMLSDLAAVRERAHSLGIPVLAMLYARGPAVADDQDPELIGHCIRVGVELGADVVKVGFGKDPQAFAAHVRACPVPVVIAGGPAQPNWSAFLDMVATALDCGAAGVSIGRNLFQHPAPGQAIGDLCQVVHGHAGNDCHG